MNIILKNLKTKTEAGKTKVDLEHVYQPLKENEDLKVHCSYFKPGEMVTYFIYDQNGKATADLPGIFRDKVTKIEGLTVETEKDTLKIETSRDLLSLPTLPVLTDIVMNTATHLMSSDGLNEDEVKNLD